MENEMIYYPLREEDLSPDRSVSIGPKHGMSSILHTSLAGLRDFLYHHEVILGKEGFTHYVCIPVGALPPLDRSHERHGEVILHDPCSIKIGHHMDRVHRLPEEVVA